jgi:hypothetical protein
MEVADNLDAKAKMTLQGIKRLSRKAGKNKELRATLTDMEAVACLGRYYADKIRGAAELAVFRADSQRKTNHQRAVDHLTDAVEQWQAYTSVATKQYRPQLFSRTHYMDWEKLLDDVKQEVETIRKER